MIFPGTWRVAAFAKATARPLPKEHVRISGTASCRGRDKASAEVGETRRYPAFLARLIQPPCKPVQASHLAKKPIARAFAMLMKTTVSGSRTRNGRPP